MAMNPISVLARDYTSYCFHSPSSVYATLLFWLALEQYNMLLPSPSHVGEPIRPTGFQKIIYENQMNAKVSEIECP